MRGDARRRRGRPQPDRAQVPDRVSVAAGLAPPRRSRPRRPTVFESGAFAPAAASWATTTMSTPRRCEAPSRSNIRSADQVQIYESTMADSQGPHHGAPEGRGVHQGQPAAPAKDSTRRRPSRTSPCAARRPARPTISHQTGDRVRYHVDVARAVGPFQIAVELRYQPIAFRWAINPQGPTRADEPRRFVSYFEAMSAAVLDGRLDGKPAGAVGRKGARTRRPRSRSVRSRTTRANPCGPCCPWLGTGSADAPTRQGRAEPPQQWFWRAS